MRQYKLRALLVAALVSAAMAVPTAALACNAGHICGYTGQSYSGLLFDSTATGTIDFSNNVLSSLKNRFSTRDYCGIEADGWPDRTVITFTRATNYPQIPNWDNQIDHVSQC